jgi:hypothetical protein
MMAKDPADRYQTARQVATDLGPFAKDAALHALLRAADPDARPALPKTVPYRRKPRWRWGVVALLVVLLPAVGFYLSRWLPGNRPTKGEDPPPGPIRSLAGLRGPGRSLAFAGDSRRVAAEDGTCLHCWDLENPDQVVSWQHEGARSLLAHSNVVFVAGGRVVIGLNQRLNQAWLQRYDARSGALSGHCIPSDAAIRCLAVSPYGGRVLASQNNGWVRIRDAVTDDLLHEFQPGKQVRTAAFSADGKRVLCGCDDGSILLHDLSGKEPWSLRGPADVLAVALFAGGRRACAASRSGQTLRVWDVETGAVATAVRTNEDGSEMTCAAFTPDGRMAVTGHADGSVRVWDFDRHKNTARYRRHEGPVASVALAPDGRRAASAGETDRLVWLYRTPVGETQKAD